jgi:arginase family enzyme
MNPADYLDPTDALPISGGVSKDSSALMNITPFKHGKAFPIVNQGDLVILGLPENRNSSNSGASKSPDLIRAYFYSLSSLPVKGRIIDAGNLKPTKTPTDSYSAIKDLVDFFLAKNSTLIILGGTQEISLPIYQGIKNRRKSISVSFIDSRIDMGANDGDFSSTSYLQNFLDEPLEDLFNISLVGYQGYLTDPKQIERFTKSNHETLRLGFVRGNFREVEPTFRDSDLVSFDLGAIRSSDCPENIYPSPNGLYAEEACQLSRYSGLSDKTCCFGIFEHNPHTDKSSQSAHLSAQLIWHFIEAFSQRKGEAAYNNVDFKKFIVDSSTPGIELVFNKSLLSDSWWMEIPTSNTHLFPDGKVVVACSYNDYLMASKQELPEKWIRIYNKIV